MDAMHDSTSELFWSKLVRALPSDQTKIHQLFKQAESAVFSHKKAARILTQTVYFVPFWDLQKGHPTTAMGGFAHDFPAGYPGLSLPEFKPFPAIYPLPASCTYIRGERANREGKHPRGRPSVCSSLISSGWSLREADKLKTFPSQHSPEGLSVPAPLLLLITLHFGKQQAALRCLSLCRPVERAHPSQCVVYLWCRCCGRRGASAKEHTAL